MFNHRKKPSEIPMTAEISDDKNVFEAGGSMRVFDSVFKICMSGLIFQYRSLFWYKELAKPKYIQKQHCVELTVLSYK